MAPGILYDDAIETFSSQVNKSLPGNLTERWPVQVSGNQAWDLGRFNDSANYTYTLTIDDIVEVEEGLRSFKELGLDGHEVTRENFRLPTLQGKLLDLTNDLHRGKGFGRVAGLDSQKYSPEDNITIFLGISSYVGEGRGMQDIDGNMLVHKRVFRSFRQQDDEAAFAKASSFHTNPYCDILAFQVRNCALEGGNCTVVSSSNIYNKLRSSRGDLVETLASPDWHISYQDLLFPNQQRPLLYYHGGHIILDMPKRETLSRLTLPQMEALDVVQAASRECCLTMETNPGDLIFINNHALMHSRESFKEDEKNPRHLVRMWLKNPKLAWKLPSPLLAGSNIVYNNDELNERWTVVAIPHIPIPWNHLSVS
jgi:hypothetical protein